MIDRQEVCFPRKSPPSLPPKPCLNIVKKCPQSPKGGNGGGRKRWGLERQGIGFFGFGRRATDCRTRLGTLPRGRRSTAFPPGGFVSPGRQGVLRPDLAQELAVEKRLGCEGHGGFSFSDPSSFFRESNSRKIPVRPVQARDNFRPGFPPPLPAPNPSVVGRRMARAGFSGWRE